MSGGPGLSALDEYDRMMAGAEAPPAEDVAERGKLKPHDHQPRPPGMYVWFAAQGIGEDTVDDLGLYVAAYDGTAAMVFPYHDPDGDRLLARAYSPNGEPEIKVERGSRPALFNAARIAQTEPAAPLILAETELDAARFIEAGFPGATCAPPGLMARAIAANASMLGTRERFILGISDTAAREEIARRFGRHRCWSIVWPPKTPGCMSAWQAGGRDALITAVADAEPWPLDGVQIIKPGVLTEYRKAPPPLVLTTGTYATDQILRLPGDGRLIIISGIPSHGKTSWAKYVMVHQMQHHDRRFLVFSPESNPWQAFVASCAEIFIDKPLRKRKGSAREPMADVELAHAEQWLRQRLLMLTLDAEDKPPTLDWLFEKWAHEVLRFGVTDVVVDPWNELDHNRNGASEAEYIGRSLQRFKAFATRHGINVWVITHPTKLLPPKPGAKVPPPSMYDISGGAMWANKADVGIIVHTEDDVTMILAQKLRFAQWWGRRNGKAMIVMDTETGRYRSANTGGMPEGSPLV